jgi:hypothetical protein
MSKLWSKLGGVLGIAYCIVGFFLIFLGWNGAASYDREPAQIPYLISGGLGGLALVVVGSALIVVHSLRADRVELQGAIEDLPAAMGSTGAPGGSELAADESLAAHRATTAASAALWTAEKT